MNIFGSATKAQRMTMLGVIITAVVIVAVVLLTKEETYRTIAIEEVNGTTIVKSEGKDSANAYEGMHLHSGDDVAVQNKSDMTMVLDMDKYVYAEPGTHFWLECAGSTEVSRTVICMDAGSVLNRIKDNLNEGEVYQVDTPNSTMAVRGTVFRVTVYRGEDGLVYTLVEVFEGKVQIDLKTEDGEYNGVSETFGPGEAALIRGNSEFSEFVIGEEGTVKQKIAYKEIPQGTAEILVEYIDDAAELCIGKELLMDYTELAECKLETREGKEPTCTEDGYNEIWCSVCNEVTETQVIPALGHTPGEWEIIKEPSCTEVGIQQKICSVCGEVCEEEELEMTAHTQGEFQVLAVADCVNGGAQAAYCTVCGEQVSSFLTDPLGHTPGASQVVTNASCTSYGTSQITCTVCGAVLETSSISPTGHSMGSWETVRSSTCTESGKKERECSVCGYTESESKSKLDHDYSVHTHTYSGERSDFGPMLTCTSTCSMCGGTGSSSTAVAEERLIETEEDEYVTYTCSTCGADVTDIVYVDPENPE